jgi:hypothetical protein
VVGGTLQVRFNGPLETATKRYAREDVTISGVTISCGELVFAVIASANRDDRRAQSPSGPRTWSARLLGAPLARLEGQIATPIAPRGRPWNLPF